MAVEVLAGTVIASGGAPICVAGGGQGVRFRWRRTEIPDEKRSGGRRCRSIIVRNPYGPMRQTSS
jgi:hypothetical protein